MRDEPWPNTDDEVRDRLERLGVTRDRWLRARGEDRKVVRSAARVCAVIEAAVRDVLGATDDDRLRAKADAYLRSIHTAAERLNRATGSYTAERDLAPRRVAARAAQAQVEEICRDIAASGRQNRRRNVFNDDAFIEAATKELNRRLADAGMRPVATSEDVRALGPGHGGVARAVPPLLIRVFQLRQPRRSANRPNSGRRPSGAGSRT